MQLQIRDIPQRQDLVIPILIRKPRERIQANIRSLQPEREMRLGTMPVR